MKGLAINEEITAPTVRVIDENGQQLGVLSRSEALRIARERNYDLIEVASQASPPVCRLLDYGRYKYEQTKKQREARKHQHVSTLREVRLTPVTDDHDLGTKTELIRRFLDEGDRVKVTIRFRGRQMTHPQLGVEVLETIIKSLKEIAAPEGKPNIEGRNMSMVLVPGGKQAR